MRLQLAAAASGMEAQAQGQWAVHHCHGSQSEVL
eukprot:CAMPEP_0202338534 /NCGR_PEP_ID=MMETSP1126-20121109/772_1 /ASSEMBLY_ACC=CAM_ASM_000457 /TAXON_ID=3047 /ORGANISM="Dunaliella tertiolecta, Strain CCMP1320" /LENGTH=33 /DNA_ID= /DNA_START= /DNA_END= /DNA_ORIENTATION=